MKREIPKIVTEVIAQLRAERTPLAARLDALDLAIDNLNRVYGLSGTPQPEPLAQPKVRRQRVVRKLVETPKPEATLGRSVEAAARRDELLGLIAKSEYGLTAKELKKATPKMAEQDRSNALTALRMTGRIKRQGNVWAAQHAA